MSENGTEPARDNASQPDTAVSPNQGPMVRRQPIKGQGAIPQRFTNPGLAPHVPRAGDLDEKAAHRAERQVATLFAVSMVATVVFVLAYFGIDQKTSAFIPAIGQANLSNVVLGLCLAVSLLGIGFGAVHWAKTLMPDTEASEDRHPMRSPEAARHDAVQTLAAGGSASQLGRRPLIKYTLGGALALVGLGPGLQLAGGLGPLPGTQLATTFWRKGMRLMRDPEMTPIKAIDVTVGSLFHVLPEGIDKAPDALEEKAKAAVVLIGIEPGVIQVPKEGAWGYGNAVAYSKICTHVGCPVGLYEHRTHQLMCPCHQSTFDMSRDAEVTFGPAHRPLPQLKITVDTDGYLIAAAPFVEPVGPSYWER